MGKVVHQASEYLAHAMLFLVTALHSCYVVVASCRWCVHAYAAKDHRVGARRAIEASLDCALFVSGGGSGRWERMALSGEGGAEWREALFCVGWVWRGWR